jgi:hypothetical protein
MNLIERLMGGKAALSLGLLILAAPASAQKDPAKVPLKLGASQMIKLVIPQPYSSNRLEYDYIFPIVQTARDRYFLDAKVFASEQPLIGASAGSDFIQAFGQSARLGVRTLFEAGTGFRGVSVGYDSLWQQGEYYQQLGAALEYTKQDYQLVLTMGLPLSAAGATPAGATPLASVNVQVSLPTGYPGLAVQPRVYVVGSNSTGSAVGGQLQFTYSFARSWSATLASNYDDLTGVSGSLTFQVLFPRRQPESFGAAIHPSLINSFAGAVGNNGSRVIRLDNAPAASGN